jgi:hypothetical protein
MLKIILPLGLTLCLAALAVPLAQQGHANTQVPDIVKAVAPSRATPTPAEVVAVASVTPVQIEQLAQPQEDPWFALLRARVEELSDAYMDKPHMHRGLQAGEPEVGRAIRLNHFTQSILDAVHARAGELAQFGPDAAWDYAVTLACIAHRETRIASSPAKLGNQDGGRAAGPWQIWERRDHADRFSADTALDMLIKEPTSSWALPAKHPWTGYPECSAWLSSHRAP